MVSTTPRSAACRCLLTLALVELNAQRRKCGEMGESLLNITCRQQSLNNVRLRYSVLLNENKSMANHQVCWKIGTVQHGACSQYRLCLTRTRRSTSFLLLVRINSPTTPNFPKKRSSDDTWKRLVSWMPLRKSWLAYTRVSRHWLFLTPARENTFRFLFYNAPPILFTEPERPGNALDFVKKYLGAPPSVDVDGLQRENEDLKKQVEKLKKQLLSSDNKSSWAVIARGLWCSPFCINLKL